MRVQNFRGNHQPPPPNGGNKWLCLLVTLATVLLVGAAAVFGHHHGLANPLLMALTVLGLTGDVAREVRDRRPGVAIWPVLICGLLLACGSTVIAGLWPAVELDLALLLGVIGVLVPLGGFLS